VTPDPESNKGYAAFIARLDALEAELVEATPPSGMARDYADLIERVRIARGRAKSILAVRERGRYPGRPA
jgi:hypothetical protein